MDAVHDIKVFPEDAGIDRSSSTWPSSTPPSTRPPRSDNYSIPALSLGTCPQHLDITGTSSTSTCRSICCYGLSLGWPGRRSQHAVLMANPRPRGHSTPHTEPGVWGHALFIHSTAAGVFVAGLPRRATKDVLVLAVSNDCGNLIIGGSSRLLKRLVRHHITIPFLVRAVKTKPRARLYTRDVYANMPPQGTVTFRNQVTCVVVDAAALATNAETESTWPPPTVRECRYYNQQEAVNSPARRALFPLGIMPYTKQLQHVQDRGPQVLQKLERRRGVQKPAGQQNVTKQSARSDSLPAVRRLCSVRSSITNYTAREMQDTEMRVVRAGYSIGPK
ncbi:hypothetical protein OOU_Y34scaffold00688g7 [Pyricularia oryzae Y34]|uniref:Uncharacterized protein n=2 Tax=Pyricularia oryzae TaxID=318829 RepID=A0AA97NT22_PYRO3|nr:hypothetical protein OOU_Y34scaffold00688g7 [Pyricularia oryzae Y34]